METRVALERPPQDALTEGNWPATPEKNLKIGVTGTRRGITDEQRKAMIGIFQDNLFIGELHQGCCIGADEEATFAAFSRRDDIRIVAYPPIKTKWMSDLALELSNERRHPQDYYARDRAIVASAHVIMGMPRTEKPQRRSGTWYTLKYAWKMNKSIWLILPSGNVIHTLRGLVKVFEA